MTENIKKPSPSDHHLTKRAGLTFASQLLQQFARFVVGFVVNPIVVKGLGGELYGAWVMLQQSVGYFSLSDLRPMGTLKLTLSVQQHIQDNDAKRRQIGAALIIWAFSFPIFCLLGIIAVFKMPDIIHISPVYTFSLQIAVAILICSIAIEKLFSLPANVLRGMNLEYTAMGLNAFTIVINGVVVAVSVWMKLGLPGLAGASILGIIISGIIRLFVAKNALVWFGFAWPKRQELIKFAQLSLWLFLSAFGSLLLTSSDILLVGFILGPVSASVYAMTGTVLKMTMEPIVQLIGSGNSGIAGICGEGDWGRVNKVRTAMFTLAIPCCVIVGVGDLLLNKVFVALWVGSSYFGGQVLNVMLVVAAIVKLSFRIDNTIVLSMLELKRIAFAVTIVGSCSIGLGWLMLKRWGLPGMAISTCIGYLLQWLYYQKIISSRSNIPVSKLFLELYKPILFSVPPMVFACWYADKVNPAGWVQFTLVSLIVLIAIGSYVWFCVVDRQNKQLIITKSKEMIRMIAILRNVDSGK